MQKHINKECSKHGLTIFVLEGRGYYRCKKCRVDAVNKRRKKIKRRLVEHFGGVCQICGYDKCVEALQFHHIHPDEKDFGIAHRGVTLAYSTALKEANKCILLCANCHAEVEAGITCVE